MMFPDYLDGAKVIEYTQRGSFAFTADPWNDEKPGMVKEICYVAICRYDGSDRFNVFWCDEDYGVLQDWLWDSIAECKQIHKETANAVWCKK